MGLLSDKELKQIHEQISSIHSGLNYVPLMKKDNKTIILDKIKKSVYYVEDNSFEKCYKIQTKEKFMGISKDLQKEGWIII